MVGHLLSHDDVLAVKPFVAHRVSRQGKVATRRPIVTETSLQKWEYTYVDKWPIFVGNSAPNQRRLMSRANVASENAFSHAVVSFFSASRSRRTSQPTGAGVGLGRLAKP